MKMEINSHSLKKTLVKIKTLNQVRLKKLKPRLKKLNLNLGLTWKLMTLYQAKFLQRVLILYSILQRLYSFIRFWFQNMYKRQYFQFIWIKNNSKPHNQYQKKSIYLHLRKKYSRILNWSFKRLRNFTNIYVMLIINLNMKNPKAQSNLTSMFKRLKQIHNSLKILQSH